MAQTTKLTDVTIFTGYSYIGSCKEFVWIQGDRIGSKQLPSRFIFRGLVCEYDVEALMIRKDLYLRTREGKEYIVSDFQITDISDAENVGGVARNFDLLFEKFPELKSITTGEKVIITKKTQVLAFKSVSDVIHQVKAGHGIDVKQTDEVSKKLVDEVLQQPDAIMNLMDIKSFDDYTFTHNINVATISLLIGLALKLPREEMDDLGIGALLHDVGKLKIPLSILNKDGKLTDQEFMEMKSHPTYGYEILSKSKGIPERARMVALQHHEKFQGGGYPRHLKGIEISLFGRICAVADVYDALTTDRPYRVAMTPYEAMKILTSGMDNHFDPKILGAFIRKFSLYPAGSLVSLNDGTVALVLKNNPSSVIRPVIKIVADSAGRRLKERVEVNLLEYKDLFITGPADASKMNVTASDK
ncbi:MAG: phosphodiesterase [Candidatus Riflebacteria bacterium HGW-Riflebacteria-2]|jgi:HD-GYP domain-containing protein (c-di-GMP phosphodiesterase class II)|nr:MAG: phosphodiesterase [Candidatus Riflebacteria bacterium HGW-Riflebacteria-2]